jgi:hypothetical protein
MIRTVAVAEIRSCVSTHIFIIHGSYHDSHCWSRRDSPYVMCDVCSALGTHLRRPAHRASGDAVQVAAAHRRATMVYIAYAPVVVSNLGAVPDWPIGWLTAWLRGWLAGYP